MYNTCPKCGHQRRPDETASSEVCPACGLVYAKWLRRQLQHHKPVQKIASTNDRQPGLLQRLSPWLFHLPERVEPYRFWSQLVLYLLFLAWGGHFIWLEMQSNAIGHSFMHTVNLVFHEAGHVIFIPLGEFMTILGGSLFQVLVPLIVAGTFLVQQRDPFAASIGLWWAGQSLMDVAPYINDARARQLTLLGGGTGEDRPWMHDWYNLLGRTGLLHHDHRIASLVDTLGELTVLLALAWGGYLLHRQFRLLRG